MLCLRQIFNLSVTFSFMFILFKTDQQGHTKSFAFRTKIVVKYDYAKNYFRLSIHKTLI